MTVETVKAVAQKYVLVGVRLDGHSRELLSWAIVKVAEPGDTVLAIHVCRGSYIVQSLLSIMLASEILVLNSYLEYLELRVLTICCPDDASRDGSVLDNYLEVYEGLCHAKKVWT